MDRQKIHELTMLYLEKQDLKNIPVSQFLKKYQDTYEEIKITLQESKPGWIF